MRASTPLGGQNALLGILYMCLAASLFPFLNASVKHLTQHYPLFEVAWVRGLSHFVFLALFFWPRHGFRPFRSYRPKLQALRSCVSLVSNLCYFAAISRLPMTDVAAISFVSPFIVTALSVPFLGEKVGWRRWAAIGCGFLGAMIVVRPGGAVWHWAVFFAFGSAFLYAVYQLLTRHAARFDSSETSALYTTLASVLVLALAMPMLFEWPRSLVDGLLFLGLGLFGGLGHFCVAKALQLAEASKVSPFNYAQLVGTVILSYVVFGDFPDAYVWFGSAIIVASGLYIADRERRLARRRGAAG
ncbi:MAG: DMT family transporter [Alphaproteobacteria bacterium]|nr:DMT family transporter [Alphaproteobacteria bacterium]